MKVSFDDVRRCINAVQVRADAEVTRCINMIAYQAGSLPDSEKIDAHVTGASLGQHGESQISGDCRRLDAARAQAAAVRNVWLAVHSTLGPKP